MYPRAESGWGCTHCLLRPHSSIICIYSLVGGKGRLALLLCQHSLCFTQHDLPAVGHLPPTTRTHHGDVGKQSPMQPRDKATSGRLGRKLESSTYAEVELSFRDASLCHREGGKRLRPETLCAQPSPCSAMAPATLLHFVSKLLLKGLL